MAVFIRRLSNLAKPFHANATTRPQLNLTLKSLSTETSKKDLNLERIVDIFKKSSENHEFRRENTDDYFRIIKHLANASKFDMIEDIIEHQKLFPDIHYEGFAVRLINLYGIAGMFDHARKLFDQLRDLGCPRTVKSLNALLKAGIASKEFRKVVEAFESLPSSVSIEPDLVSRNSLVRALCELGLVNKALSKHREMGKNANVVTYNTLSLALYKSRRFSEAEDLWVAMEESGIGPDARSYQIRLRAMFSEKKLDQAVVVADEMMRRRKGIEADAFVYDTMIVGFCGNGNLDEALRRYDDLQERKYVPNLWTTYLALIPACCEVGDFDRAFELCIDAVNGNFVIDSALLTRVIDGLDERGKAEKVLKLKKLLSREE